MKLPVSYETHSNHSECQQLIQVFVADISDTGSTIPVPYYLKVLSIGKRNADAPIHKFNHLL
jgi:hypothetical protein